MEQRGALIVRLLPTTYVVPAAAVEVSVWALQTGVRKGTEAGVGR